MASGVKREESWYAGGLKFRCTACGQCCTGEPGHVWVTPAEIRRIAKARGLSVKAFERRFVVRLGKRLSLRELESGDCCMLKDGRCTVYEAKPLRCSTYPFWDQVLEHESEWHETAARCEGIGQGDTYSFREIEQLRAGDPEPMREKHEREPESPVHSRFGGGFPRPEGPDWTGAFRALEALYAELDRELPRWKFTCSASGNCCDFDAYGHRLFVTTLEAEYFFKGAPAERVNGEARQCPAWGEDRLCKARESRMLGCRTYFCPPYPVGVPQDLHEGYQARIKALHERFGIPYAYRDVIDWAAERRPVPGPQAAEPGPSGRV